MRMMKRQFHWWRKPEHPEEPTDLLYDKCKCRKRSRIYGLRPAPCHGRRQLRTRTKIFDHIGLSLSEVFARGQLMAPPPMPTPRPPSLSLSPPPRSWSTVPLIVSADPSSVASHDNAAGQYALVSGYRLTAACGCPRAPPRPSPAGTARSIYRVHLSQRGGRMVISTTQYLPRKVTTTAHPARPPTGGGGGWRPPCPTRRGVVSRGIPFPPLLYWHVGGGD